MSVKVRFARTVIVTSKGDIKQARIDLTTGEIKQYTYNRAHKAVYVKPVANIPSVDYSADGNLLHYEPFWASYAAVDNRSTIDASFKPRKTKGNPNNVYLTDHMYLKDAAFDINFIDDLIEGVSRLDDGKNSPLNKSLLFNMLRDLDVINSATVQEYTGYSERHSQKLAMYMRVLSRAFDTEVDRV